MKTMKVNRREFGIASAGALAAAASATGIDPAFSREAQRTRPAEKIPLGFDNFSIRAHKWKADRLIDFAVEQKLDSVLLSDLDVYENHEPRYLQTLGSRALDAGILIHAGTGGICPTSSKFKDKWGTAEDHLRLVIRIAKDVGSPVARCYLGSEKDRHGPGGIQKHIDATVEVLKKVKSFAIDSNVKIAVENHAGDMQARELVGLIEAAGKDFVGATVDSGNATWTLEHPLANLELLGPYTVSSGIRDSTVWEYEAGANVAWNAVGEGQIDWKTYTTKFAELCPGIPFQLEIISGLTKPFAYHEAAFWDAYPDVRARDFVRFLELAKVGKEVPKVDSKGPDYQMNELVKSIRYCKTELGLGLKT
jgi:sugar phosphate isomerase/epimerase